MSTDSEWYRDHDLLLSRLKEGTGSADAPQETITTQPEPKRHALPKKIGRFHVKRVIASGGMGTVYEAIQEHPRRSVAVKVMKHGVTSRSAMRRFEYESQILARLRHPGIAQIFEAGTHDDPAAPGGPVPYFAMEYIPSAKPITGYAREKKLPTRQRMELFAQVCDAVHHGHQKGIIHRDLKPSNILVDSDSRMKIIDFGVARGTDSDMAVTTLQTNVGQLIGTLQYMSPEQCEADSDAIDTRSDVYALGVLLYELVSGKLPYDVSRAQIYEATRVIREREPTKLTTINKALRGDVETIVLKALEKDRDRRYQSASELAQDIRRYLAGEAVVARPPSIVYQLRIFARRNRAVVAAVAAVFVVLVAASIVSTSLYFQADRARAEAVAARTAETEQRKLAEANEQLARQREQDAVTARDAEAEQRRIAEVNATRAQQVAALMTDMLGSVGPAVANGRDTALLREILDRTAERIDTELDGQPEVQAELWNTVGWTYYDLGLYERGKSMLQRALALRRSVYGEEHPDVADSLSNYTHVFMHTDPLDTDEAETLVRDSLALNRRVLGEEHEGTIEASWRLGRLLRARGRITEAETQFREVLSLQRRIYGEGDEQVAVTLYDLAELLKAQGNLAEAEKLNRESLALLRKHFEPNPIILASILRGLAVLLHDKGDHTEAEQLYREALVICQQMLGPEHPELEGVVRGLGEVLRDKNDLAGTEALWIEHLEFCRSKLTETHSAVTAAVRSLASFYRQSSRIDRGEDLLKEHLDKCRGELDEGDPAVFAAVRALGAFYSQTGHFDVAEPLYREALAISRKTLGPDRPRRVQAIRNLANLLQDKGDGAGAIAVYQEYADSCRDELGEDHPAAIEAAFQLGVRCLQVARYDLAEQEFKAAYEQSERVLGETHATTDGALDAWLDAALLQNKMEAARDVATRLIALRRRLAERPDAGAPEVNGYAWILLTCKVEDLRDPVAALPLAEEAVELTERKDAASLDTLALAYHVMGDLDKATETQREAVAALAAQEPAIAWEVRQTLARYLEEQGDNEGAERMYRDELARRRSSRPQDHGYIGGALIYLGQCLNDHGKFAEAEPILRECLELRRKALSPGHWLIANAMSNLGESLTGQGKFAEAEPLLLDGYGQLQLKALTINYRFRPDRLREVLDRIIDLYESWDAAEPDKGYAEKAAEWRAEMATAQPTHPTESPSPVAGD